jgi:hypothetical protein
VQDSELEPILEPGVLETLSGAEKGLSEHLPGAVSGAGLEGEANQQEEHLVAGIARIDPRGRIRDPGRQHGAVEAELVALQMLLAHYERIVNVGVDQPAGLRVEAEVVLDRGIGGREQAGESLEPGALQRGLGRSSPLASHQEVEVGDASQTLKEVLVALEVAVRDGGLLEVPEEGKGLRQRLQTLDRLWPSQLDPLLPELRRIRCVTFRHRGLLSPHW